VPDQRRDLTAKLMLVGLSVAWGLTWPAMRFALAEMPPFSMRFVTMGLGAATLFAILRWQRRDLGVTGATAWAHVAVAGVLNIVGFSVLAAFAQLSAGTSRVVILAYTMPIWSSLMAWAVLGERLDRARGLALALCVAGMIVLIYPLAGAGLPGGIMLAIAAAMSWAAGTVYLKWARIPGDPITVAAWQLVVGFLVVTLGLPFFEGWPHLWPLHAPALVSVIFVGVVGSGIAYLLWFDIIMRLPAMTASLGVLMVPMIGVVASILSFGERPTLTDLAGFALIFAASACVLIASSERVPPEPT
jgi:drug/metabolite transporter (DMT)-like permease